MEEREIEQNNHSTVFDWFHHGCSPWFWDDCHHLRNLQLVLLMERMCPYGFHLVDGYPYAAAYGDIHVKIHC